MTTEDTELQTSLEPSLLQVHTGPDSAIHQPIYMDTHPSPSCYYRAGVQGRNAVVRCDRKKSEDERRGAIVPFWHELRGLVWLFFFSRLHDDGGGWPAWSSAKRETVVTLSKRSFHPGRTVGTVGTDYSMAGHQRIAGPALADLAI